MKIRNGFVSNSSSSSFILHKSEVSNDQWWELIDELEELRKNPDKNTLKEWGLEPGETLDEWGESGKTFEYDEKYLIVETNYVHAQFEQILDDLKINHSSFYKIYY